MSEIKKQMYKENSKSKKKKNAQNISIIPDFANGLHDTPSKLVELAKTRMCKIRDIMSQIGEEAQGKKSREELLNRQNKFGVHEAYVAFHTKEVPCNIVILKGKICTNTLKASTFLQDTKKQANTSINPDITTVSKLDRLKGYPSVDGIDRMRYVYYQGKCALTRLGFGLIDSVEFMTYTTQTMINKDTDENIYGTETVTSLSAPHNEMPPNKDCCRVETFLAWSTFDPVPGEPNQCFFEIGSCIRLPQLEEYTSSEINMDSSVYKSILRCNSMCDILCDRDDDDDDDESK